jgi:large subunit ribosomal protein L17
MRHGKKINHLSRKTAHRKAMLSNMACSLIQHKRIETTVAKAKALRVYIEPLLTKSKTDSTHSRRIVFRSLQSKDAVTELFREVSPKIADRPGGYTRIVRLGNRLGDNAEMCMIELVDYNELMTKEPKEKKTRRSRRGGSSSNSSSEGSEAKATEAKEEKPKAEKKEAPKAEAKSEKKEAPKAEAKEAKSEKKEAAPKAEKKEPAKKAEPKAEKKEAKKSDDKKDEAPKSKKETPKKEEKKEDKKDDKEEK